MDKMAIFVEGQTEQCFVVELVRQIAGQHRVHIDAVQAFGGGAHARRFNEVHATRPDPTKKYYVLVCDCSNDNRVLSDIRDQYDGLIAQNFREIIGVRDVYPQPATVIPTIRMDFATYSPQTPLQPLLVLAIMEIEAWFIAEHTHFFRLDSSLTLAALTQALGYDPSTHDVQTIPHPSEDLRKAYNLAGRSYNKSRTHVQRTVGHLDLLVYYIDLPKRLPDLQTLIDCINKFLS